MVFFDSNGAAWVTCASDEPDAEAFGPAGTARRITAEHALRMLTAAAAAAAEGLDTEQHAGALMVLGLLRPEVNDLGWTVAG